MSGAARSGYIPLEVNPSATAHIEELRRPRHNRWVQRRDAALALTSLPLSEEERKTACATLRDILNRTNREAMWRKVVRGIARPLYVFGPLYMFLAFAAIPNGGTNPPDVNIATMAWITAVSLASCGLLLSPISVPISLAYDAGIENRVRAAAANALGELKDVASLLALAQGLVDSSREVRYACGRALNLLLPIPGQEHLAPSLMLSSALGKGLAGEFGPVTVKILGLLEFVGIGQELPAVRRLAEFGRTEEVRQTASRTAAAIERRIADTQNRALLLRATGTLSEADTLVRPAMDSGDSDKSILLRPSG
jgi:HEAT repeat protein